MKVECYKGGAYLKIFFEVGLYQDEQRREEDETWVCADETNFGTDDTGKTGERLIACKCVDGQIEKTSKGKHH